MSHDAASPVCARCPKVLGGSCCEVKGDEQLATLTWADADRLREVTGRSLEDVTEWEWLGDEEVGRWALLHPNLGGYFGRANRRLTLRRRGGACVFHGPNGCGLTAEQRPTACRLYPFAPRALGEWGLQVDRFGSVAAALGSGEHACLAVEEADSFEALWALFGTTRAALEVLAERQRAEAKEHQRREQALHSEDPR